jgi:hypothetical protein
VLKGRALPALVALPFASCGGGPGVDGKAEDSVERLDQRDRAAAQVLVELEEASRDEDAERLCRHIYVYKGTAAGCEQAFKIALERDQIVSVDVKEVRLSGDTAVAGAKVTTVDADDRRRTSRYTFRLVKRETKWRVELLQ